MAYAPQSLTKALLTADNPAGVFDAAAELFQSLVPALDDTRDQTHIAGRRTATGSPVYQLSGPQERINGGMLANTLCAALSEPLRHHSGYRSISQASTSPTDSHTASCYSAPTGGSNQQSPLTDVGMYNASGSMLSDADLEQVGSVPCHPPSWPAHNSFLHWAAHPWQGPSTAAAAAASDNSSGFWPGTRQLLRSNSTGLPPRPRCKKRAVCACLSSAQLGEGAPATSHQQHQHHAVLAQAHHLQSAVDMELDSIDRELLRLQYQQQQQLSQQYSAGRSCLGMQWLQQDEQQPLTAAANNAAALAQQQEQQQQQQQQQQPSCWHVQAGPLPQGYQDPLAAEPMRKRLKQQASPLQHRPVTPGPPLRTMSEPMLPNLVQQKQQQALIQTLQPEQQSRQLSSHFTDRDVMLLRLQRALRQAALANVAQAAQATKAAEQFCSMWQ